MGGGGKLPIVGAQEKKGAACGTGGVHPIADSEAGNPAIHAGEGFAGNVLLVTLGCAKNLVDSEVMLGALRTKGFRPIVDPEHADLIVVNTCAFLQSAVEEGIDRILELSRYKEEGRCRRLVVAGCMVERYRDQLASSLPEVDRFISTDELLSVADEDETTSSCFDEARRPYFIYDESMPRIRSTQGHTAYVKVAEGCDRPCAFCIIPKIRGSFRSRPIDSIVGEMEDLESCGVREINLVAQDLTSYGIDLHGNSNGGRSRHPGKPQLTELLQAMTDRADRLGVSRSLWIRLLYAYPIGVDERLIRTIADSPVICNYLDLPLQHISHAVLKRMNRPLGERGTRGLIEQIRATAPEVALRTTFIVGFPGETEEDIQSLEQFVGEGHFTQLGVFTYSQESEAKAYTFPDQVPDEVKEERRRRIMEVQQTVVARRNEQLLHDSLERGRHVRVLVDGYHADTDLLLSSRSEWQGPETDGEVIINDVDDSLKDAAEDADLERILGRFGIVELSETAGYDLVGRLVSIEGESVESQETAGLAESLPR